MTAEQFTNLLLQGLTWGLGLGVIARFFGWCVVKAFRIMKISLHGG